MAEPKLLPFDWADPFQLDGQLSDEERLVRDTSEGYAQERLLPRVTEAFLDETFGWARPGDRPVLAEAQRATMAFVRRREPDGATQ